MDVIPAADFFVEAKVSEHHRWCSSHTSGTMNVNFQILLNHRIQSFHPLKHSFSEMGFIKVMYRKMNGFDLVFFIVIQHFGPVCSSMCDIDICLNIEYPSDACGFHCFNILFQLWVRPNNNISTPNLFKS